MGSSWLIVLVVVVVGVGDRVLLTMDDSMSTLAENNGLQLLLLRYFHMSRVFLSTTLAGGAAEDGMVIIGGAIIEAMV